MMPKKKKPVENFVHLHLHSDMSQLDGCGKISDYVAEAARRGSPAIAFTEHGTMRGYHTAHVSCKEHGIKAIHGIEFYLARDMHRKGLTEDEKDDICEGLKANERKAAIRDAEDRMQIRKRNHITVWAKNNAGLVNLYKLSSMAYLEGFYYKPRIDVDMLFKHGDGLMMGSGCMDGLIATATLEGKRKEAFAIAEKFKKRFGDDYYLEVMPNDLEEQKEINKMILAIHEKWGGSNKLVATQDAHYILKSDARHHDVLLAIGTGDTMSNPERFKFTGDQWHFRTRKEMKQAFLDNHPYMTKKQIREALDTTVEIANKAQALLEIDYHAAFLPKMDIPADCSDEWDYLKKLCYLGWKWREIPRRIKEQALDKGVSEENMTKQYKNRLVYEMNALKKQKFVPYFLMVYDIYAWARKSRIMCGPGRGSVAGSLVSFLLGLSAVDPLEHGLIFERFINPNRIDMPDVDMDFEDLRRKEIIQYLRDKYGEDCVAQIATIGKLSGKQCLKDIARVYEVPYAEVNEITASIIERSSGDERASQTIEDSFKDFQVCRDFNDRYPMVLDHARHLEGMAKNLGIHAAGAVVAPRPLVEYLPLEVRKSNGVDVKVTALDMHGVSALGLVKLDVLGLRTLTVLRECIEAIEERTGKYIDLEQLGLNDKGALQGFTDHDYAGIFQYDTPGADKICSGVKFERFEDIAAMTALNRPGTARSGLATEYVARKKDPEKMKTGGFHKKVAEITSDTLGIIVYQEHVIKIFIEIAGFAPGTADSLRKSIAKKHGDETIGKERNNFIEGAMRNTPDMTLKQAEKIIDAITFFGSYGFNKSHATSYGIIAYWGMWLKMYYPLEFYWALLKNEPESIRIQQIAKDAKRHDIELLPPNVSVSKTAFSIDTTDGKRAIRGSLIDIKGIGEAAATTIMENQPYVDFADFINRVNRRACHRGAIGALAKAGALGNMIPNVKWFVENIESVFVLLGKKGVDSEEFKKLMRDSALEPHYADEEKQLVAASVNPLAFGKHPIDAYQDFISKHVKVEIVTMADDDFFTNNDNKAVFVAGVIVEVKYNQIGDFHTGKLPTEEEKAHMYWGSRYANVNVEDAGGVQNRIKFDIDIFDEMRPLIDAGIGTPVVVHAIPNAKYANMRADYAINLEEYRKKVKSKGELSVWEQLIANKHPAKTHPWPNEKVKKKRVTNSEFKKSTRGGTYCGVVTHVKKKIDKRGNEMAFIGISGATEHIEIIIFGSHWPKAKKYFKMGKLIEVAIDKQRDKRGISYFYNGGGVRFPK